MRTKQLGVRLDEADLAALQAIAQALGLQRSSAVRYAIRAVAQQIQSGVGGHSDAAEMIASVKGLGG